MGGKGLSIATPREKGKKKKKKSERKGGGRGV